MCSPDGLQLLDANLEGDELFDERPLHTEAIICESPSLCCLSFATNR